MLLRLDKSRCVRTSRIGRLFLLAGFCAACASAAAQEELPANLLLSMTAALRALDYQGSFVYQRDGEIHALRIVHKGAGDEQEKLISLNGPRSEVLREDNLVTYLQADGSARLLPNRVGTRLLPLIPDTRGRKFQRFYAVGLGGEDRVAGYGARVVDIAPRDGYRYGYRLWLEQDSKLPLRSALVDAAGREVEQFMFVALDIHAPLKAGEFSLAGSPGAGAASDEVPLGAPPRWQVSDLPPGFFYASGHRPYPSPNQVEHYVYSDGVANVSVYVEPRDPRQPAAPDAAVTRGALNVYARSEGEWRFTVLGDVPRATVQRMARSLQPASASATR